MVNDAVINFMEGPTLIADGAVAQWSPVKYGTNPGEGAANGAATDHCISVALRAAADGDPFPTAKVGSFVWVIADGTITPGTHLCGPSATAGKVTAISGVGDHIALGFPFGAATADGHMIPMLLMPHLWSKT